MNEDSWSLPSLCKWFELLNKKRDDAEVKDEVHTPWKRQEFKPRNI